MADQPEPNAADPHSSFRLEITLAVGYQRKRTTLGGALEGHVVSIGLMVGGIVLIVLFVDFLFRLFGLRMLGG